MFPPRLNRPYFPCPSGEPRNRRNGRPGRERHWRPRKRGTTLSARAGAPPDRPAPRGVPPVPPVRFPGESGPEPAHRAPFGDSHADFEGRGALQGPEPPPVRLSQVQPSARTRESTTCSPEAAGAVDDDTNPGRVAPPWWRSNRSSHGMTPFPIGSPPGSPVGREIDEPTPAPESGAGPPGGVVADSTDRAAAAGPPCHWVNPNDPYCPYSPAGFYPRTATRASLGGDSRRDRRNWEPQWRTLGAREFESPCQGSLVAARLPCSPLEATHPGSEPAKG